MLIRGDVPLVSIVLPTRNRAHLLPRAVESVAAQTFRDWELIVVDDGSTDETAALLATHAAADPRILTHVARAGGAAVARNRGAARARGRYLAFIDDDAEWLPDMLERHLEALKAAPAAGLAYCALLYHDERGSKRVVGSDRAAVSDPRRVLLRGNEIDTSCVLLRRPLFDAVGGFDETLPRLQDWDLWLRLAGLTRFCFVTEPLVRGYFTSGSISSSSSALEEACRRLADKLVMQPGVGRVELGDWYYALGHTLMIGGAPAAGRDLLVRAVGLKPWPPRRLVMVAASLAGPRAYGLLAGIHRSVVSA